MADNSKVKVIPATLKLTNRVAIYCRVSSHLPEQLDSLVNQISGLTRTVATTPGWTLVDTYIDIKSGSHVNNRQEFQRMINDCRLKHIDIILTKSISRFGRNPADSISALNELTALGVEVRFLQENVTNKDQFVVSILSGIAEEENKNRSENIRWGIKRKVQDGTSSIFTRKCYGYNNDENRELCINNEEAENVNLIFNLYLKGFSIIGIIRELEARKIKSPTGKDKWCKRSIDVMLSNEKYTGDAIVFKTYNSLSGDTTKKIENIQFEKYISSNNNPSIISKEIFDAVQQEKQKRSNIEKTDDGNLRKSSKFSSKSNSDSN